MAFVLMTQTYKRLLKLKWGLQKLKWLIFDCCRKTNHLRYIWTDPLYMKWPDDAAERARLISTGYKSIRPLTAKLRRWLFSSVPHVSDRLELRNNNWASGILHTGSSESDVYSDVIQEAQLNDLLHTARLSMRLDTPLHDNNARGIKYAVYYASVVTHKVFENLKNGCTHAVLE